MATETEVPFESLLGKTLHDIHIGGFGPTTEQLLFITTDKEYYRMHHRQDCCEYVRLEETIGNMEHLLDSPIRLAEKVTEKGNDLYPDTSRTWTFYKLGTIKGFVTFRWLGESNGYYSEEVNFTKLEKEPTE